jgi:hypothetical protein
MPKRSNIIVLRSAGCALALVLGCASKSSTAVPTVALDASPRPTETANLPAREALSLSARMLLSARMQRHGESMVALMNSVVVLDWTEVKRATERLIDEPMIAPPLPGNEDSFNNQLPPSFFVHQQTLLSSIRSLHEAAVHRDDHELKVAFNGVADACIQCHSAYLHEAAQPNVFETGTPCEGRERCDVELR